ncbi:MAG: phosphonate C-P lyase system protein PhnH [Devosia sp.]|jgi:alpha-D-ribose 1-methylphosphonate 5-triphosphate synthase subunit PhnH|uniref:phosphonate C-P lyase system protein PhnH n=1 Tax=unclassified Devosia TaxID=196773 RepID=UPI0019E3AAFF|nr:MULTISPECIES: phosphonate C-P lyase system protein PhnH [unclassified Devosia]MBF0678683.1 phosphonate C-P lyase system protein PhnH [Devosia sp.]WEJ31747.1 phosphonate C-P lyase system protein PhnH [Devosia sp. SD17-2]
MRMDDFSVGFADPVRDSQAVFRVLLDALATPGAIKALPKTLPRMSDTSPELVSTLLTLTGPECEIALSLALQTEPVRQFVAFHTGARLTDELEAAAFVFVAEGDALPKLSQCNLGTQEFPDRSTTIIVAVTSLTDGPQRVLRGPGIETEARFAVSGLPEDFVAQWSENRELFPRGVDMIFVSDGQVLGLPRTTRMVEA